MIIGIPKEIKRDEYRVAVLPVGVEEFVRSGHQVLVETGAGLGSGLTDNEYSEAGAELVADPKSIFDHAELILKVKEPQPSEWPWIRRGQIVFTYFHFAADQALTEAMRDTECVCVAYETLRDDMGRLPLLTPMSEVAGRMSIQEGAKYLERPQMGAASYWPEFPAWLRRHVTILGGGVVGANAAKIAAGFQADVVVLDINMDRLRDLDDFMPPNVNVLYSDRHTIRQQLRLADLVIGAILIPGAKAPRLIHRADLTLMKPGSVVIDVAIDARWLLGNESTDDAQQPDLHRRGGRALLRYEYARSSRSDKHIRALQCYPTVGDPNRESRVVECGSAIGSNWLRDQYSRRSNHESRRR